MSKINAIRKKAIEHVRKQNWQSAVKEYRRLSELDHSNPNVFNELGDIYLKTGSKSDAYDSFVKAVDAYARVSLHNNAVAVCKKVLRLIPSRIDILIKLGYIRTRQGLSREAESYYASFLDKILVEDAFTPDETVRRCNEIVEEFGESTGVLEKVCEVLEKYSRKEDAGPALLKLHALYGSQGRRAERDATTRRLEEIGVEPEAGVVGQEDRGEDGAVITENNIWSAPAHSDGERITVAEEVGGAAESEPIPLGAEAATPDSGEEQPAAAARQVAEMETAGSGTGSAGSTSHHAGPEAAGSVATAEAPAGTDGTVYDVSPEESATEPTPEEASGPNEAAIPSANDTEPWKAEGAAPLGSGTKGDPMQVSAILNEFDAESGELDDEDHRSHYDLGMAYLEMDLFAEAIREYQFSAKSQQYRTRALEMIGLCFLKQNQPKLAIKQLKHGLTLIGEGDPDALGIKYNLGLAYEMIGDADNAKSAFEDVYVQDVTFRDVAEKVQKFS